MFEKQYNIKNNNDLKNKINENLSEKYILDISDNNIVIKNKKGTYLFSGNIESNNDGLKISGNFKRSKILSIAAGIIAAAYIIVLIMVYCTGFKLYDFQILLMIIGAVLIIVLRKIDDKRIEPLLNIFEKI